jgi:hypothetical protein
MHRFSLPDTPVRSTDSTRRKAGMSRDLQPGGARTTPYVVALGLSVVWTVGVYAMQAQIQPS